MQCLHCISPEVIGSLVMDKDVPKAHELEYDLGRYVKWSRRRLFLEKILSKICQQVLTPRFRIASVSSFLLRFNLQSPTQTLYSR